MTAWEWVVLILALASLILGLLPALLVTRNLTLYQVPPLPGGALPAVSVLIPARNEETAIGPAIEAVRASRGIDWELIILDDQSTDGTASIIDGWSSRDQRIRRLVGQGLPEGWCGKQFACWQLAREARHEVIAFLDADVRLEPDGLARMVGFLTSSGSALVSGVPRQITQGFWEKALIPQILFILLGFLPLARMRQSRSPAFAAGCGQFFVAKKKEYFQAGGHDAIRMTLHDGLKLPAAFRKAGLATDLCDATPLASCRMYTSPREVMLGLMKNATEGLARPGLLEFATILLLGGQVLPFVWLGVGLALGWHLVSVVAGVSIFVLYWPRFLAMGRFAQDGISVLIHPLGIATLVCLQWLARWRQWRGQPSTWRGRVYSRG